MSPVFSFAQHLVILWLDRDQEKPTNHSVLHQLYNMEESQWWSSAMLELGRRVFVKDVCIKLQTRLFYKNICFLLLRLCSPTQRIGISSRTTMLHTTQPGESRSGWRITRSRSRAMWKTGEEHAKKHESSDCKSGLFHQWLISERSLYKELLPFLFNFI